MPRVITIKVLLLIVIAMTAFAANSILCRMALGEHRIDAASFTSIRLLSGALLLGLIVWKKGVSLQISTIDKMSVISLFLYAIFFSFSYIDLGAGTGALILFGTVQLTMIISGLINGERPTIMAWAGIIMAIAGLAYLLAPGVSAPSMSGSIMMIVAGISWGIYSIRGKIAGEPITATARNFIGTIPLTVFTSFLFLASVHVTSNGIILAVLSGAIASGVGYAIWYATLPHLTSTSAATVQLSVPVIAAFGGVLFINEALTFQLMISSIIILGGIALVILSRRPSSNK